MRREKLIQELSSHLSPVKRIYPVWIIFLLWILFSFFTTLVFVWTRSENFVFLYIPKYKYDLVFIFLAIISSAFIAIYTSIPGNRMKGKFLYTPIILLSFWIFSILLRFVLNNEISVPRDFSYHHCTKDILLMGIPSASILVYIINRRVLIKKNWIGFWIITASLSVSALGVSFLCSNEFPAHVLLVHAIPILLMGLLGIFLGRLLFREHY